MTGADQYDAGTIREDQLVHAVNRVGVTSYALCGSGRITYTIPAPFVPGSDGSCSLCAGRAVSSTGA